MTIAAIRKRLMAYIAEADDKKIKGLYMFIEDEIEKEKSFTLSDEHLNVLEQDRTDHIEGKSKSYGWEEAKEIIRGKAKP
jgi:hypothetical protein